MLSLCPLLLGLGGKVQPRFAVVSIKPRPAGTRWRTPAWGAPGPVRPGGRYVDRQATLYTLIRFAYPRHQHPGTTLLGLPPWAIGHGSRVFDLEAEAAAGTNPTRDEMRLMMRAVLANRFGLKFHMENKTAPVYYLRLRKGGPRNLHQADARHESNSLWAVFGWYHVFVVAKAVSLPELAGYLIPGRTVINQTGFSGYYDINIPQPDSQPPPRGAPRPSTGEMLKEFFAGKLGMDLIPGKASIPVMVIDSAHLPTRN